MRLMITDSGLGGLSVCAGLEEALRIRKAGSGLEILYVNATPDDRIGYNALASQSERIVLFDQFLKAAFSRYSPDSMIIACNTLSVIYDETDFSKQDLVRVKGIVGAGVELCQQNLDHEDDYDLIIFATETTTEADTYPQLIHAKQSVIVGQACPGLAHAISNAASGAACQKLLEVYVQEALDQFDQRPQALFAFLGCTHYGYQAQIFQDTMEEQGIRTQVLNPNDLLVQQLLASLTDLPQDSEEALKIRFISRYAVPQVEIDSMEQYLSDSAPLTLSALYNQEVISDLFDPL